MLPEAKGCENTGLAELGQFVLSRAQMRAYDARAISDFKLPGILLMENAGRSAAELAGRLLSGTGKVRLKAVVVCGTGNNGGDGFVLARHLNSFGVRELQVEVFVAGESDKIAGDAKVHFEALLATGQPVSFLRDSNLPEFTEAVRQANLVVDAVFGTGLSRPVDAATQQIIAAMNRSPGFRLALDLPSGLDADTGEILGAAVKATHTISFAHAKPGLLTPRGSEVCGLISVAKIGFADAKLLAETSFAAEVLTAGHVAAHLQPRLPGTYKHRSGDVLLFAGSEGKTGAAHLAAVAALRTGTGLATVATWREAAAILERASDEVMVSSLDAAMSLTDILALTQKRQAVAVGPGFGLSEMAQKITHSLWHDCPVALTLDADALTNLAGASPATGPRILTPHAGEMARLLDCTAAEVERDRYATVRLAANKYNAVVVLKGAHTLIAGTDGRTFVSPWANAALATAGSGDVLTGIICALSAALEPLDAACCGVYLHALTAHLWTQRSGTDRGMLASDIVQMLPLAFAEIAETRV